MKWSESKFVSYFCLYLKKKGCLTLGLKGIGLPDRLLLFPNGKVCFVEFKTYSKVSNDQNFYLDKLSSMKFDCRVIRFNNKMTSKDVQNLVDKMLNEFS